MLGIFDVHAHYDDEKFDADREEVLSSMAEKNVICIVNAGTDIETSRKTLNYCEKYNFMYGAVGIHPECADKLPQNYLKEIENMAMHEKAVAIGEIGLDYYWDGVPRDIQKKVFTEQLELAYKLSMPVVIHDRDAHGDTMEILRKYKPKGIMHCFSGSVELMREAVKLGCYISLGGVVTFKNARHSVDVAAEIPIDRLLLETDAPYMAPVPFRGKRCDSSMIIFAAKKIASLRNMGVQELLDITAENAKRFYNI